MAQHDEQRPLIAGLRKSSFETPEVAGNDRAHVGVDHGGRDALVLLDLRENVGRDGHVGTRHPLADEPGRCRLVSRIAPRVQIADRHRRDAGRYQRVGCAYHRSLVERRQDAAIGAHPLLHPETQMARHERLRRSEAQVVAIFGLQPLAHLQYVAVALGRDQADAGTLALDQRIRRDRRAVNDTLAPREQNGAFEPQRPGEHAQAFEHPDGRVGWRRWALGQRRCTGLVDRYEIGECAADVDADTVDCGRHADRIPGNGPVVSKCGRAFRLSSSCESEARRSRSHSPHREIARRRIAWRDHPSRRLRPSGRSAGRQAQC